MKVYNKGPRPIVYDRTRSILAIHPRKYVELPQGKGEAIIKKFPNACGEAEFDKFMKAEKKKAEEQRKKFERKGDEPPKETGDK